MRNSARSTLSFNPASPGPRPPPAHRLRGFSPPKTPVPAICNVKRRARSRDSASSTSAATSSPISPMKRRVKWKLPGSTHFAPGNPEHSSDSRNLSSGGKPIPTKRRNMPSAHRSGQPASGKKREHTGMAIEAIARDLAIGEKADQRKFAQALADERGFHSGFTEQCGAPRDATDIDPRLWRAAEPSGELAHHADHVAARALAVAATEHDRTARRDPRTEHQPAPARVDRHQIAHEIIPGVRTGHGQPGEDEPADAPQIAGETGPDILGEHS